jgi:hypothetical protein
VEQFEEHEHKFTEEEEQRFIALMADDAIYKYITKFIKDFSALQGEKIIIALREKSPEQIKDIAIASKANVKLLDGIMFYVLHWRKKALSTGKRKEEDDARKKKRR